MPLDRAWIASRIPHHDRMCLLDEVVAWDAAHVVCRASSHRDADNPLAAHGRLGGICAIEYAAQSMAVHGALLATATARPRAGYLTAVRDVTLHAARLDDIATALDVEARRHAGDGNTVIYRFSVRAGTRMLVEGRATVVLDAAQLPRPR